MPYTFAHIGYVIPFKKKFSQYFSTTGLVFGSITPDFDILFRFTENRFHIFQYDVYTILLLLYPLTLLNALFFHLFCRKIAIKHLPDFYEHQYADYIHADIRLIFYRHFLKLSFSVFFAILLHLFLDNLCHFINAYSVKIFILDYTQSIFIAKLSYIASIYLLPVLFTVAGFYLFYKFIFPVSFSINHFYLSGKKKRFWYLFILYFAILTTLKIVLSTIEKKFIVDFFAITFTSSLILAFYLTCLTYYFLQLKTKQI